MLLLALTKKVVRRHANYGAIWAGQAVLKFAMAYQCDGFVRLTASFREAATALNPRYYAVIYECMRLAGLRQKVVAETKGFEPSMGL